MTLERNGDVMGNELMNCTFVKTILMLLVVLYHSMVFWSGNWIEIVTPAYSSKVLEVISAFLNSFHIYGFSLVSGYLYYFVRFEKQGYQDTRKFVEKKVKRLLIPFYFVSFFWAMPFGIFLLKIDIYEAIKKYLFGTSPNQLWFLLMLFWSLIILHLVSNMFKKNTWLMVFICTILWVISIVGKHYLSDYMQFFSGLSYVPFVSIGFLFRQKGTYKIRQLGTVFWIVLFVTLFVFVYIINERCKGSVLSATVIPLSMILHLVGAIAAFLTLQRIAQKINWQENNLFSLLSKYSMTIYLFHQQIVYLVIVLLNGVVYPFTNVCANFLVAIVVSLIISWILTRFKITRALTGNS